MPLVKPDDLDRLEEWHCTVCGKSTDASRLCLECKQTRCNVCLATQGIRNYELRKINTFCGVCGLPVCNKHSSNCAVCHSRACAQHGSKVDMMGQMVFVCGKCQKRKAKKPRKLK